MPDHTHASKPPANRRAKWRAVAAGVLIVGAFAGVVVGFSLDLRKRLRAEILNREGELLHAVTAMQSELVDETLLELGFATDTALEVASKTSRLRGVLAVRIFDQGGEFRDSVPLEVDEGQLPAGDLAQLAEGRPVVRFHPDLDLSAIFLQVSEAARAPMLEVVVPFEGTAVGDETLAIQYWINGLPIEAEFSRIDEHVFRQAGVALLIGVLFIAGSLFWAVKRLSQANVLLRKHAEDLARANRELGQAARTSAIGAITAHLMHGLRNPLAGLEGFVSAQADENGAAPDTEWAAARESTRRLRSMVNEVQMVLSDVDDGADFELTTGEVCAGLLERVQPVAQKRRVNVEVSGDDNARLPARAAGLGGLVLANLVQNAIEVTEPDGKVEVSIERVGERIRFSVIDHGPGLPAEVATDPFRPRRSTKPDGAGIGLAISRELARHADGELELARSGASGTIFRVELPAAVASKTGGIS